MAEVATPRNSQPKPDGMRVLFLSRLHPAKGLELLLRVWARIEATHPAAALEVVGPDEGGHGMEMEKLARDLRLRSVRFLGPLVGDAKQQAFARADLYVLPTHSENFGLTVAEALAAGSPVICTKGAPWSGLETHRCGWWIDRTEESLFRAIDAAHRLPAHVLTEMGARGREWVIREFSWTEVARRMNALYAWLLGNGGRPECVHEE
jgi:glycosyltransferase involved in cell wall biosynthesis